MKLSEFRKKRKMTQKEMADFFGVSLIVYSSWEQGKRMPRPKNLTLIKEKTKGEVQPNDFYEVSE